MKRLQRRMVMLGSSGQGQAKVRDGRHQLPPAERGQPARGIDERCGKVNAYSPARVLPPYSSLVNTE